MQIKTFLPYTLALTIMGLSLSAYAEKSDNDTSSPILVIEKDRVFLEDTAVQKAAKSFNLDWGNYASVDANRDQVEHVQGLLSKNRNLSEMDADQRHYLGTLYYKMASYYSHILVQPAQAIAQYNKADALLNIKSEKSLINSGLAYAYAQKYAQNTKATDKAQALSYANDIITRNYNAKNPVVAFAYYVKAYVLNSDKNFAEADRNYKIAAGIYSGNNKDDQAAIVQNDLANNMLQQNGHDQDAMKLLQNINNYWQSKSNINQNPYAAINYITLGKAFLKLQNPQTALTNLNKAVTIYTNIYGDKSELLKEPYDLLAAVYLNLNDQTQAENYLLKADAL